MFFSTGTRLLTTVLVLGRVFAADSSSTTASSSSASSTSSAPAATWTVSVGSDGFNFSPNQLNASVGDIIEYRFYPQNHSVARAGYGQPCIPYEYTDAGRVGFYSGFMPIQLVTSNLPKFQVRVNDTDPIFFYCSAPGACLQGMVGVINPNSTETYENQFAYSQNATEEFSPGENIFPVETAPLRTTTATGATTTPTAAPATTSASSTSASATSSNTAAPVSSKHSLGGGPIAGIAIGGVIVLILAIALVYMCGRQKTMSEILHRHSQAPTQTYRPASTGLSEAQYPNMVKYGPGGLAGYTNTETDGSYRSASPPIDERTGMMTMNPSVWQQQQQQQQYAHVGANGGTASGPGSPNSNSGQFSVPQVSPAYYDEGLHTHDPLKPYPVYGGPLSPATPLHPSHPQNQTEQQPNLNPSGPHELPTGAVVSDPNSPRPFSFTDSESGYASQRNEGKIDDMVG